MHDPRRANLADSGLSWNTSGVNRASGGRGSARSGEIASVESAADRFGPDAVSGRASAADPPGLPFEQLDFLYTPSRDVAADIAYFTDVLGARLLFAIDDGGTKVAMLELSEGPPRIVLADHVEGDAPIMVYRVASLDRTITALESRGWRRQRSLEIPQGPLHSFHAPGGQRIAVYERTRPGAEAHFIGRQDFQVRRST